MEVKVKFNDINVKEEKEKTLVKVLMLKGEKGEKGDGDFNVIEDVKVNGTSLPVSDKSVNVEIPTNISSFNNDSGYLVENDMKMVKTSDIQNGSQITDGTGYGRLNKVLGDTSQVGTPTPDNPIDIEVVTGDVEISISNSDNTSSQNYLLSLEDIELCKIRDYKDYIYKENDKWYLHKEIGKVVYNGSENWNLETTKTITQVFKAVNPLPNILSDNYTILNNYFIFKNPGDTEKISLGGGKIYIAINKTTASTVAEFKTWLSTHNVEVYYVLATPTNIEITDTILINQLNNIKNFSIYENETNFTISGDDLIPSLNITYAITNRDIYSKEEVDDKLDNLDNKINEEVNFIFPKFMPNQYSGDCNLIKYKDKNIVFDSHSSSAWSYIKAMLDDNEVKHIDYFVLTHYHSDHYGNFKNLVNNGYIDSDTRLFMPAEVSVFPSEIYTEYKTFCENNNLTYYVPSENEVLNIYDLKITFNNCDAEELESLGYDQNSCSTVALIEYKNIKAYYSGDAGYKVHNRMISLGFLKGKIDLYKQGHHGIDVYASAPAVDLINPTFTIQTSGINDFKTANFTLVKETNLLLAKGTQYYPCHMQTDYIKFVTDGKGIYCKQGRTYDNAGIYNGHPHYIYVDENASVNSIQEGTSDYPFSELMQAVNFINTLDGVQEFYIILSDGHYGIYNPSVANKKGKAFIVTGKDKRVIIRGNSEDRTAVIIDNLQCLNSRIHVTNLTIRNDLGTAVYIDDSDVILSNVLITSENGSLSNNIGLHVRFASNVLLNENTKIENCTYGINCQSSSVVVLNNVEFGSNTVNTFTTDEGIIYTLGNVNFENTSDKLTYNHYINPTKLSEQIMESHENFATTVNLKKSTDSYEWIEIFYRTSDGIYGSSGRIYSAKNKKIGLCIPHTSAAGTFYNKQCEMEISNMSISILNQYQTMTDENSYLYRQASSNYFNIEKVIGGYKDYIDF